MNHPASGFIKVTVAAFNAAGDGPMDDQVRVGILEEVGTGILYDYGEQERWGGTLVVGNVLHYRSGYKIGDSIFLRPDDIVAYEEAASERS
jgi:hypothetical protein